MESEKGTDREERLAVIDRMREAFADVPPEELERKIAKALAEVRDEMAAERNAAGRDGAIHDAPRTIADDEPS